MKIEPGMKLQDRYEILSELGRGGMGAVYKAQDPLLDRIVAIKTLSIGLSADESFVRRFQHEARAIARLNHPGIVGIFDVGQDKGFSFIVMEFIPGGSLEDLLKRERPLPPERVGQLLEQVAIALDFAHSRGFVHRDIKPANILLDDRGQTRLTDFGLVKADDVNLTMPGQIMGTPRYMAPEQIQGEDVGAAADIYALGVVAYEMLAGEAPFTGAMSTVFDGHVRRDPPLLRELNPNLPEGVEAIVRRVLAKEPEQRFDAASEFVQQLRHSFTAEQLPTMAAPPSFAAPVSDGRTSATVGSLSSPSAPPKSEKSNALTIIAAVGAMLFLCFCLAVAMLAYGARDNVDPESTIVAQATVTTNGPATPLISSDEPGEPVEPELDLIVSSLEEVRRAVVQIEAQGSFVDAEVGLQMNQAGRGSGFIIDPSGLVVTNNHVVTGAALLRVYLPGEARPRNARVLGVSECSDLAVIQVEGEAFPSLQWYTEGVSIGQEVHAAGFPLGDSQYTLTEGAISATSVSGVTNWAALDDVLSHSAAIHPGSSGGPLLNADGRVIGINFASAVGQNQFFAIGRSQAVPIIEQLQQGQDVYALGINGVAINDSAELTGIWVSSVKAGSPADIAGLQPGDVITAMQGLLLATDGTMADYCAVLRSHGPEDTLSIQVHRVETDEILTGQINGRPLEVKTALQQHMDDTVTQGGQSYDEYEEIIDSLDALSVEVPVAWVDFQQGEWTMNGEPVGRYLSVAGDLDAFFATWEEPGLFFGASRLLAAQMDEHGLLDEFPFDNECDYDGRYEYEDPLYTGYYDFWYNCGGLDTSFVTLAVTPADRSFLAYLQIILVTDADFEALQRIFNTYIISGTLP